MADTGSSDATVRIAQAFGAFVLSVPWADDFASARNSALEACATDWVLSIDADEVAQGSPTGLRTIIASAGTSSPPWLSVQIAKAGGPDARGLSSHRESKLFRAGCFRWSGRVHERLVATGRNPVSPVQLAALPDDVLSLVHYGYEDAERAAVKAARNARLCELELDHLRRIQAPDAAIAIAALDLGRSWLGCGRTDLARPALQLSRTSAEDSRLVWQWATDFLIRVALQEGCIAEAVALTQALLNSGAPLNYCRWLLSLAARQNGDPDVAQLLLADVDLVFDLSGNQLAVSVA